MGLPGFCVFMDMDSLREMGLLGLCVFMDMNSLREKWSYDHLFLPK